MAHEELKALYKIDKRHTDEPYLYWEFKCMGDWVNCWCEPVFYAGTEYRRKPGAPWWLVSDDAEDARKWRELEASVAAGRTKITYSPPPDLIQGYTAEQWQAIIDGNFLCEFSDDCGNEDDSVRISVLRELCPESFPFYSGFGSKWKYCRPLRTKGVRQPWFGGECPVARWDAQVYVKYKNGPRHTIAARVAWENVTEFIEL